MVKLFSHATIVLMATLALATPVLTHAAAALPIDRQANGFGLPNRKMQNLNLTEEQRQQIQTIRERRDQEVLQVLTPEQRTQVQQARQNNQRPRNIMKSLNLTPQQREQIKTIRTAQRQEISAVLTPEQRQMWQQRKPQR